MRALTVPAGKPFQLEKMDDLGMKQPMPGRVQTLFFSVINFLT